jgi:hypothetical protein
MHSKYAPNTLTNKPTDVALTHPHPDNRTLKILLTCFPSSCFGVFKLASSNQTYQALPPSATGRPRAFAGVVATATAIIAAWRKSSGVKWHIAGRHHAVGKLRDHRVFGRATLLHDEGFIKSNTYHVGSLLQCCFSNLLKKSIRSLMEEKYLGTYGAN